MSITFLNLKNWKIWGSFCHSSTPSRLPQMLPTPRFLSSRSEDSRFYFNSVFPSSSLFTSRNETRQHPERGQANKQTNKQQNHFLYHKASLCVCVCVCLSLSLSRARAHTSSILIPAQIQSNNALFFPQRQSPDPEFLPHYPAEGTHPCPRAPSSSIIIGSDPKSQSLRRPISWVSSDQVTHKLESGSWWSIPLPSMCSPGIFISFRPRLR